MPVDWAPLVVAVPGAGLVLGVAIVLKKYIFPQNGKCPAESVFTEMREGMMVHSEAVRGLIEAVDRNTKQSVLVNETLIRVLVGKEKNHG